MMSPSSRLQLGQQPASITQSELSRKAPHIRRLVLNTVRSSGDEQLDREVFDQSMDEVAKGWISGPLDPSSLPSDSIISRRFGIRQGQKIRVVDDLSQSMINATVQVTVSPKPHTVDYVAAVCKFISACSQRETWLRRSFDLKSAYRQVSYIAVFDPQRGKQVVFQLKALPFGSVQSVHTFLRVSNSLWFIGINAWRLSWTAYFDDFVCFSKDSHASLTGSCVSLFFDILGWMYASSGDKANEFGPLFDGLGITFDISSMHLDITRLVNTDKRIQELKQTLTTIATSGKLSRAEALRLQFAAGQVFGRSSRRICHMVTEHAYLSKSSAIGEHLALACEVHAEVLESFKPRSISSNSKQSLFVLTDASFDRTGGDPASCIGGVLVNGDNNFLRFFSTDLSTDMLQLLGSSEKETVIFECEMIAVSIALDLWKSELSNAGVVTFVDNNSARDYIISAKTSSAAAKVILRKILVDEENLGLDFWIARVPSPSNIADLPSRREVDLLLKLGARRDFPDVDSLLSSELRCARQCKAK